MRIRTMACTKRHLHFCGKIVSLANHVTADFSGRNRENRWLSHETTGKRHYDTDIITGFIPLNVSVCDIIYVAIREK